MVKGVFSRRNNLTWPTSKMHVLILRTNMSVSQVNNGHLSSALEKLSFKKAYIDNEYAS